MDIVRFVEFHGKLCFSTESIDRATDPERHKNIIIRISFWDLTDDPSTDNVTNITIVTEVKDEGEFDLPLEEKDLSKIISSKPINVKIDYDEFTINPTNPNGVSVRRFLIDVYKNFWQSHERGGHFEVRGIRKIKPAYYEIEVSKGEERNKEKI